jgi:hypothetical protein
MDARQEALQAEAMNRVVGPVRLVFSWAAQEPSFRASGEGVIRMEPPYRARMDLFAGNGEGVARAALVDDELRLPPEPIEVLIPPPAMFWATLGVFRPGPGAALLGANPTEGGTRLRYGFADGTRLHYEFEGRRIRKVEMLRNDQVEEEVLVTWDPEFTVPSQARYRKMRETREIRLSLESIENVEAYPPDIWLPRR